MEFAQLTLKTNNSIVGPYYAMQFRHLKNDFKNYIQNVTMKAHLDKSNVSTDDIAYFAPALSNLHQKVILSFHYIGTVANFEANDLLAQYNQSNVRGRFSMQGLPDLRSTQINFSNVKAYTNY